MEARVPTRVEDGEEDEPAATEERARNREAGEYALPAAHVGKQATEGAERQPPPRDREAREGHAPALVSEPPLDGEREEEGHSSDNAADNEEGLEEARADVGDVRDVALLRDILGSPAREPSYEHRPQRR